MRWAASVGTRYWTPHCAARRTTTGSVTIRPITDHERSGSVPPGAILSPAGRSALIPSPVWAVVDMECSSPQSAVPLPVAYWILKVLLTPVFYLLWSVKVEGREHIPAHGPAILA